MLDPFSSIKTAIFAALVIAVVILWQLNSGYRSRIEGHSTQIKAMEDTVELYKNNYSKLYKAVSQHEKANPNCKILTVPDDDGGRRRIFPWFNDKNEIVMPPPFTCECSDCKCVDCKCGFNGEI